MRRRSLLEYLDTFRRRGREIAYAEPRGYRTARWSYGDVAETAAQFARELEASRIGTGDRVLLWGENSAEWVAAFWGCLLRGTVVVPMDRIATPDFALRVARQVQAKLLVCSRDRENLDPALHTLVLEDLPNRVAHHARTPYPRADVPRDHIVQIVFTSGTTAEPKGVLISHGNILANLEPLEAEIQRYLKYERFFHPLRLLNLLPLSHVFGQFLAIFVPPLFGATVIFQTSLNPSEALAAVKRERVSVLVAVPRVLETLRDKLERDLQAEGQLDWLRREMHAAESEKFVHRMWRFRRIHRRFGWKFWAFVSGGAALPAKTEAFWSGLGFAVIQGYGLTETTSLVSVNHPFRLGRGSIGKVLPGREIKLAEDGEILVRGESIAAGYWHGQGVQPLEGTEGGWLRTGDLGEVDAEGNLYFKGRKKNIIVTPAGMNIYPEDLEAALGGEPEVRDSVVIGLARDGNAEPCAVLLLRDAASDPAAIIRRANARLAEYQHMRRWFVWPERDFPRTPTQKPRTSVIAEFVQAQLAAPSAAKADRTELAELIARLTGSGRAPVRLSPDAQLATDLNLSSLDRLELLSAIEDHYQIDLNETAFTAATTIGELEQMLGQPAQEKTRRTEYAYPRWAQRWPVTWVRLALYYLLSWPATWLLATPRIRGREHLRGVRGPMLVVANHTVSLDAVFVLAALPMRFRHRLAVAMGGERLRLMHHPPKEMGLLGRWLSQLNYALVVALFNVFPLPKQSGFRGSFQFAGELVDCGYSVLVFPEGELTPDGNMAPFRAGIGLLANKLGVPVVPVRLDGLYALKVAKRRNARLGQVRVTIGAPARFEPGTNAEQITRELERRVRLLSSGGICP